MNIIKALFYTMFLCSSSARLTAQTAQDSIYNEADQMPYFAGCDQYPDGSVEKRQCSNQGIIKFIEYKLELPDDKEITVGKIYASFIIDAFGNVQNPQILRGGDAIAEEAVLKTLRMMPRWEAARHGGKTVSVTLTMPFNFNIDDGISGGYTLLWGQLKGKAVGKNEVLSCIEKPVMVRDGAGNEVEVNELLIERERDGKFTDAQSNGKFTPDQIKIVKKLKSGDRLSVTATVQRGGVFYYVTKDYLIQ